MLDLGMDEELTPHQVIQPSVTDLMDAGTISKDDIAEIAKRQCEFVTVGNAIEISAKLTAMKEAAEQMLKAIKPQVLKAVSAIPENERKLHGFHFVKTSTKSEITLNHDPQWVKLKKEIDVVEQDIEDNYGELLTSAKADLKAHEDKMKEYIGAKNPIDLDGYGVVHGAKVKTPGTPYVQVKFMPKKKK